MESQKAAAAAGRGDERQSSMNMDVLSGFMHAVAVSGVLYLFLGFFGIAGRPVKWGFLDSRGILNT